MSSSKISSGNLRRPDENSSDECERTEGRHVAVTAFCPCLPSPPVDVTEETAVNELNGRTTDVCDSTSAGVFPRPELEGTAVDAVHSPSRNEATAGEEASSDPTIDRMINGQNQPAIKASAAVTEAPPSDGDGHNGQLDSTIDLKINGGDHVAIKAPQPFCGCRCLGTLLMSSTSDAANRARGAVSSDLIVDREINGEDRRKEKAGDVGAVSADVDLSALVLDLTVDLAINGQEGAEIKAPHSADTVTSVLAPPSNGDGHNSQIDPTVDLEINGGDHVAVKAPQPFAVADASTVMLLTSSTSDAADVVGTVQARPVRASSKVARAEPAQVAPFEVALAQAMPAQARQTESEKTQVEPTQPIEAAPVQDAPA
ncbi:unnamed protein product [Spirodela intermedia]|uniref:Uncharacterized protein n=1 Tax=Spirodela intermedia TaxID=51605 RepID=A0A7I8KM05_SPIIN|nr:unnamed protein product [Spirodela intermedia]